MTENITSFNHNKNHNDLTADAGAADAGAADKLHTLAWYDIERAVNPLLKSLDKNHTGDVSHQDIDEAVIDPRYTGEQSQVLAGLYTKFEQTSKLGGGDGKNLTGQTGNVLYHTFYNTEKQASQLIGLDDWTTKNFAQIDLGVKGYITHNDLTAAAAHLSGTDKKMAQALDENFDKFTETDKLTAKNVSDYVDHYLMNDPALIFTDSFEQAIRRTSIAQSDTVSHEVFADPAHPENSIVASAVQQGYPNDCSFNAPLAALAQERPNEIKNMITKNGGNSFTVRFPGADHAVNVKAPTEAELGIFDGATKSGYWPTLLEKAYGQLKIDDDPNLQSAHVLPEDVLNQRGPLKAGIEMLTGHQAEEKYLRNESTEDLSSVLQKSLNSAEKKVVTVGTGSMQESGTTRDGFALNHGFSVLAFVPRGKDDGVVAVRDTYGSSAGQHDGVTLISLQQLKDNFTDIVYEK